MAKSEQLRKMIKDLQDSESVKQITYETELSGEYFSKYDSVIRSQNDVLRSSILVDMSMTSQSKISAQTNTDEQALSVKELYKDWKNDPDGYSYKVENPDDKRRNHNEKLWELLRDHDKQDGWYPGSDPTLWREIVEGYEGTLEDPIPVPESVIVSGFEYEYGKHYSENLIVYLCKRFGVENPENMYGQKVTLFFPPSALVSQYFKVIE